MPNNRDDLATTFYWMDDEGRILRCNDTQAHVFNLSHAKELIGKNILMSQK